MRLPPSYFWPRVLQAATMWRSLPSDPYTLLVQISELVLLPFESSAFITFASPGL